MDKWPFSDMWGSWLTLMRKGRVLYMLNSTMNHLWKPPKWRPSLRAHRKKHKSHPLYTGHYGSGLKQGTLTWNRHGFSRGCTNWEVWFGARDSNLLSLGVHSCKTAMMGELCSIAHPRHLLEWLTYLTESLAHGLIHRKYLISETVITLSEDFINYKVENI